MIKSMSETDKNINMKEYTSDGTEITTNTSNDSDNANEENYPKVIRAKDIKPAFITIS